MATSRGSPPPDTCHSEFSVKNKCAYLDTRVHHEPRGRWEEANQRQSNKARQSKTTRAKLHSNGTITPVVIIYRPTADLPVNSDY